MLRCSSALNGIRQEYQTLRSSLDRIIEVNADYDDKLNVLMGFDMNVFMVKLERRTASHQA